MNWNQLLKDLIGPFLPADRPLLKKLFNLLVDKAFPPGALHDSDPVFQQAMDDAQKEAGS